MEEEIVGTVTHYFAKPRVVVIRLSAPVQVGQVLRFRGHTTDFTQQIASMEIEHERIESAEAGAEVAIQVDERVRRHDRVYRAEG
ncbi:MAG: translation elongation factor-like protein [Gemmatimonadota bacterium]